MSKGFIVGNGGGDVLYSIPCVYPEGSILTCKDEAGTIELKASNTKGLWIFSLPFPGTWIVTATDPADPTNTDSETVEITKEGQSVSVELSFKLWLYKDGNTYDAITGGWQVNIGKLTTTQMIVGTNGTHTQNSLQTKKANIDFSAYKTLAAHVVSNTVGEWLIFGIGNANALGGSSDAVTYAEKITYNKETGWMYLDISAVNAGMALLVAYPSGQAAIDQIYATKEVLT